MKILLIAATVAEIAPLIETISNEWSATGDGIFEQKGKSLSISITGAGMVATSYMLTKKISVEKYDLILQAGIAGSFDRNLKIGEVVKIETDCFADFGAEDHDNYLDIFELGLIKPDEKPFIGGRLGTIESALTTITEIKKVNALTVNTVSGNAKSIERINTKYNCAIESMEGAAFHFVCLREEIPFMQIRVVSNYVEPRNKNSWNIPLAIANLNDFLRKYLNTI
jgi:futalosine hydrolase